MTLKRIIPSILLILIYLSGHTQDSISFAMTYLPMHKYELNIDQQLKSTTTFSGSDSVLDVLKKRGITNPTVVNKAISGTSITTTGAYNNNMTMPVQLIFKDVEDG